MIGQVRLAVTRHMWLLQGAHLAATSLLDVACPRALVAGVNLTMRAETTAVLSRAGMLAAVRNFPCIPCDALMPGKQPADQSRAWRLPAVCNVRPGIPCKQQSSTCRDIFCWQKSARLGLPRTGAAKRWTRAATGMRGRRPAWCTCWRRSPSASSPARRCRATRCTCTAPPSTRTAAPAASPCARPPLRVHFSVTPTLNLRRALLRRVPEAVGQSADMPGALPHGTSK